LITLRFREIDRDIFETILSGDKKAEIRAASPKFANLKKGDKILLVCVDDQAEKTIKTIEHFKSIDQLLLKYQPQDINPKISTREELIKMYHNFPDYEEKIKKYGLMAMEFE
jgi:ASC-1-like (ASCH) protein